MLSGCSLVLTLVVFTYVHVHVGHCFDSECVFGAGKGFEAASQPGQEAGCEKRQ